MTDGYIYCFSNISMPNILKIGTTERTPKERLKEANSSDTWKPPTPYKIEFAKKVKNPKEKETTLHKLLEQYTERINFRREFFKVSLEEIKIFFDLIDGEIYKEDEENKRNEDIEEDEKNNSDLYNSKRNMHNMSQYFKDGQRIRHVIGINRIWIGIYNLSQNVIIYEGNMYKSLSGFALKHNRVYNLLRKTTNGWSECEYEVDGNWVSTSNL
jgi:hypothetical protein